MLLDIYLGNDPYTNEYLKGLSALCTCFTGPSYWQFADVFKRRPKQNSQLQIPNDSLVEIWNHIATSFKQVDSKLLPWSNTHHWNYKGNSMETLLYMLFEEGQHLLFWQTLWVIFMHQHQHLNASWVIKVCSLCLKHALNRLIWMIFGCYLHFSCWLQLCQLYIYIAIQLSYKLPISSSWTLQQAQSLNFVTSDHSNNWVFLFLTTLLQKFHNLFIQDSDQRSKPPADICHTSTISFKLEDSLCKDMGPRPTEPCKDTFDSSGSTHINWRSASTT